PCIQAAASDVSSPPAELGTIGFCLKRAVTMPQMPSGANMTKAMKIDPKTSGQRSVTCDSSCSTNTKNTPPMIGPISVPAPPTTTHREEAAAGRRTKDAAGGGNPGKPG